MRAIRGCLGAVEKVQFDVRVTRVAQTTSIEKGEAKRGACDALFSPTRMQTDRAALRQFMKSMFKSKHGLQGIHDHHYRVRVR